MTRIVVVGTSSGGIEACGRLSQPCPRTFLWRCASSCTQLPEAPGVLPDILDRASRLVALHPRDGERLKAGRIYVAPPDCHLVLEPGRLRVTKGPKENRFRPAIDPLFRSAGQVFGPGAIGVILTGSLDDGTSGLDVIKRLGGTAIVQDPEDALYPSMPRSAVAHVTVDHVVRLTEIAPLLTDLTSPSQLPAPAVPVPEEVEIEVKIAKSENPVDAGLELIGEPSRFACPDCHGVLLRFKDGKRIRFRCHTGHAYSADSLVAAINEGIEDALWNAVRALEEAGLLLNSMVAQYPEERDRADVRRLAERAEEARKQSNAVRQLLNEREPLKREDDRGNARAASD